MEFIIILLVVLCVTQYIRINNLERNIYSDLDFQNKRIKMLIDHYYDAKEEDTK